MEVPIVQGRRALTLGGASDNLARSLKQAFVAPTVADDDAVKVTLSLKSGEANEALANNTLRKDGALPSLISALKDIAERITDLKEKTEILSPEQEAARTKELAALQTQFTDLATGSDVKKLSDLSSSVSGLLSGGISTDAIARGLASQQSLLGSNFIDLVRYGALSDIGEVGSFVDSLSSVDPDGDLSEFINRANSIERTLSTSSGGISIKVERDSEEAPEEIVPLEQTESKFSAGGSLAITFTSYSSRDLIKAAATGAITDVSLLSQISIERPATKEEKEREEKKRLEPKNSGGSLDVLA